MTKLVMQGNESIAANDVSNASPSKSTS